MTALRRTAAPALAAAILGLLLGGCGSHQDSGPQLHGAGGNQNGPSAAPMTDSGNHSGTTTSGGGINGTPTPDAASNPEFGGGASGGGTSTATRPTPDSGLGLVPGASSDGGGIGGAFPTAGPQG
jgi:hypothetical protein